MRQILKGGLCLLIVVSGAGADLPVLRTVIPEVAQHPFCDPYGTEVAQHPFCDPYGTEVAQHPFCDPYGLRIA